MNKRFHPWSALRCALVLLVLISLLPEAAPAQSARPLRGHVSGASIKARETGHLTVNSNLYLAIGLPLRNQDKMDGLLKEIYDPASPNYRHYLTPGQFTEMFGPTEADYQKVIEYARSQGLAVAFKHSNRLLLDVIGAVQDVEKAFHVRLKTYPHPTEAREFFAPDVEPSVDANVPILDVNGLDNFMPPRPMMIRKPAPKDGEQKVSYATGSGPGGDFFGTDFRNAYAPGVALTGAGQAIALFEFNSYFANDITLYQQKAGYQNIVITNISVNGFNLNPLPGADDGEEALDIDMAMSMAPGATIMVYEGNNGDDIFNKIATDNVAKQVSCSFGWSPPDASLNNILLELSMQGQSVFVSSGDGGAYNSASTIFAPADNTNITCVGGTALTTSSPGGPWQSESTWIGSGGGISSRYPLPGFQQGLSMTANHGSISQRNIPDVAALADTVIYWYSRDGQGGGVGGTSAAAPLWAGFMALVNQQAQANGSKPIGLLNTLIYTLGKGPNYHSAFHDITTGNDFNTGSPTNYSAVPGYDLCTGWGTPNGSNTINILAPPVDSLGVNPALGFSVLLPWGQSNISDTVTFTLTNTSATAINWSLGGGAAWLDVSQTNGELDPGASATVTATFDDAGAAGLSFGVYYAPLEFTNSASGVVQTRLFTLTVSPGNFPMPFSGFNAGVIVPANATTANRQATGFDIANNLCFYQAGLNANPQAGGSGGTQGLPTGGSFLSQADGISMFQLGPYGGQNVLLLGGGKPNSGILVFSNQTEAYNSLAVIACSANGGGVGSCVVHFADGSSSPAFNLNAQDWFNTVTNVALSGFGRFELSTTGSLFTENNGTSNPNFYQTTLNLAALGLNKPVASISFTKPAAGQDTGVFGVSGALMPPQVNITQQPQTTTNAIATQNATLSVIAMGAPPLLYQWFSGTPANGTLLAGATNSSLVFSAPVSTNNSGPYFAVVSNALGAVTSAVASLIVYRTPIILQQPGPGSLEVFQGRSPVLSVVAVGGLPLSYAWQFNGSPIPGAFSPVYTLASVQPLQAGNYSVVVSNAFGVVTSSVVSLAIVSGPNAPYARAVIALKPMAYWRLDEPTGRIAYDYANGNNGIYNGVGLGRPGYDSTAAIKTDPTETAAQFVGPDGFQSFVSIPTIDLSVTNGNGEFAITAWVDANTAIDTDAGILTKGYGSGDEEFNLDCGGGSHAFRFFVRDSSGGTHTASSSVRPDGKWHYLAGVCDQSNGAVYLYIDGTNAAQGTIKAGTGIHTGSVPASIGARQGGSGQPYNFQFMGLIDDAAIFTNALSAAQIQALYGAWQSGPAITQQPVTNWLAYQGATVSNGVVVANGSGVSFQWYGPGGLLQGATSSTLVLTNVQPTDSGNYYVAVFNQSGSAQSLNANLQVTPGPPILVQDLAPLAVSANAGSALTFSVAVGGTPPFFPQWFYDSNAIANATNLSYTFAAVAGTNTYYCVVSNSVGSVSSSVATVTGLSITSISLDASGGQLQLSWPAGILQSAPNVYGPYADIPSAISPYSVSPTNTQQFFRIHIQ
jgi:hypothetical protein